MYGNECIRMDAWEWDCSTSCTGSVCSTPPEQKRRVTHEKHSSV